MFCDKEYTEIEITYVGMLDRSSDILPSSFHLSRTTVHKTLYTNWINQLHCMMGNVSPAEIINESSIFNFFNFNTVAEEFVFRKFVFSTDETSVLMKINMFCL